MTKQQISSLAVLIGMGLSVFKIDIPGTQLEEYVAAALTLYGLITNLWQWRKTGEFNALGGKIKN